MPTVIQFDGAVDRAALRGAATLVLGRHPALRSRFELDRDRRQVSYRTGGAPPVTMTDAAGWSRADLEQRLSAACWTPFDLGSEAPARAAVIATTPPGSLAARTLLVVCCHHIVLDGWSRQLLMDQIGEAYRAAVGRGPARLPVPVHPAQVDPARGGLGGDEPGLAESGLTESGLTESGLAERVDEVLAALRGAPTDVWLPHDRPRPPLQPTVGAAVTGTLGPEFAARLRAVAGAQGCTTFMLLGSMLAVTLARLGAQRDFLFAFPWLGREAPPSRDAVGMFVDTLLLRVDVTGEPTWRQLLRRARNASLASYANADVPFEALAAALHPDRDLSRPPVTPVMLSVLDGPLRPPDLGPGIRALQLELDQHHVKYELTLEAVDDPNGVQLTLTYPVELFDAATVDGLLDMLRRCAHDLAEDPDAPVLGPPGPEAPVGRERTAAARAGEVDAAGSAGGAGAPSGDGATGLVEEVVQAWREVLGVDHVPLDVNFLDAGGDSLLLVMLLDRLSPLTERQLQAADLFRHATVASQARLLAGRDGGPAREAGAPPGRERLLGRARLARGTGMAAGHGPVGDGREPRR